MSWRWRCGRGWQLGRLPGGQLLCANGIAHGPVDMGGSNMVSDEPGSRRPVRPSLSAMGAEIERGSITTATQMMPNGGGGSGFCGESTKKRMI
jgi:hypothetical protein